MPKFWKITNEANSSDAEILLYGPIASEKSWFGDEVTPKQFAEDLSNLHGKNVTVRINSSGGDVFAAHAIHNLFVSYSGKVTAFIDGLAASAATIVAMGADKIVMPANSLMMIHNPKVGMGDYYDAEELQTVAAALNKIKDSIIAAYQKRCNLSAEKLAEMMDAETWLTAQECVEMGFADKIKGNVVTALNGNNLVINSVSYDLGNFSNAQALKNKIKEGPQMTKLEAILNRMGLFDEVPENKPMVQDSVPAPQVDAEAIVAAERQRVADLEALKNGNAFVDAVVNAAVKNGSNVESVKDYIDAVKAVNVVEATPHNMQVKDVAESGAENVGAEPLADDEVQKAQDAAAMEKFVNFMKK